MDRGIEHTIESHLEKGRKAREEADRRIERLHKVFAVCMAILILSSCCKLVCIIIKILASLGLLSNIIR